MRRSRGALGTGKGAWGLLVHTPASVTHGVGHPDWSHRSYVVDVEDEALDLFLFAADAPAGILDLYTQLTGRAATVPLWSLVCGFRARTTRRRRKPPPWRRSFACTGFPATC
jgi:alpha-glucosidase (family GH31 glycosyl hydrolase)